MSAGQYAGAWASLMSRYLKIFSFHWKHRKDRPTGLFTEDEAEFLPAALALQEKAASPTLRLIVWLLMLLVLSALLWSIFGRMDIVVQAEGKVVLSERTKTVASVETGRVTELRVVDGQMVHAGDLLLKLDTRMVEADHQKAMKEMNQAVLTIARNQALLAALDGGRAPSIASLFALNQSNGSSITAEDHASAQRHVLTQYQDLSAKTRRYDDDIRIQNRVLPIASSQEKRYRELAHTGDVSQDALQDREQAVLAIETKLSEARNQRSVLLTETRKQAMEEISQAKRISESSRQDARRTEASSALLQITAPVTGTVQQLSIHTVGGVVPAAQPIMQIVPDQGPIEVEAFVANHDIGFVHEEQPVALKVQAFEYTKYGTVPGKVVHISRDAIPDEKRGLLYAIRIGMDQRELQVNGKRTPIVPGMAITAEIKTGDRRVIEYVLSPLMRHANESMTER